MRLKTQLSLTVIVLLICSGCAGTQAARQPALPEMATAAELHEPPATQASGSAVPAMDTSAVVPEALAQKPETAPKAAVQKPEVRPEATAQQPPGRPGRAEPAGASSGEMVTLNFDDADIYEVVNAMSDLLGVNFIIDQRVKGRVNIHTAGEIDKSRVLPIMETIFEMNNIAMVKYDDFYKIIPIKEAKQQVVDFSIGRELARMPSYDRQMIQIVPLQYVPAKEIETMVKRFLGPGGDVFEYPKGNIVVIIERAATIQKMLRLINEVDIDLFAYNHVRFFKVENANAADVAAELEEIFLSIGIENTPEKGLGLKFIPVERVGGVLAVSSIPAAFDRVQKWLDVLDTVDEDASEQVFIYFVENGKAEEIGDVLNQVYLGGSSGGGMMGAQDYQSRTRGGISSRRSGQDSGSFGGSSSSSRSGLSGSSSSRSSGLSGSRSSGGGLSGGSNSRSSSRSSGSNRGSNRRSMGGGRGMSSQGGEASTLLEADVSIVVDIPTNAIIVRAIARDYEIIKRTMVELDKIPRQVLIEVLIAEVTLSGDTEFGVEWALLSNGSIGGYDGQQLIGVKNKRLRGDIPVPPDDFTEALGGGFSYLFSSDKLKVFIQAQASQNKLNILSSPHILAVDNMEARIEVGEEVPLVTSEYSPVRPADRYTQTSRIS